jgi:putative ABC transport system ATP-binding protein
MWLNMQLMDIVLETRDLTKHYSMGSVVVRALDGITLRVARGEFLGLLGTSGSGKSTLLNLIAGLDRPTSGSLRVFDHNLADLSREALSVHRRKNVGMIFQSFNLIPTMTAAENVALSMMFAGVPRAQRERHARELLEKVGLAGRQLHRPSELSGGEQQRVAIARSLANHPEILLADEPTGNLDSKTAGEILALLRDLNTNAAKTVILVTHDSALASKFAQRTMTLLDGKVVAEAAS